MGSVVISDVLSDFAHYPHTMVVGDVHQVPSTASERIQYSPGHSSQTPHPSHPQRYSSRSATPTRPSRSGSSSSSSRPISQHHPIDLSPADVERRPDHPRNGEARNGEPVASGHQELINAQVQVPEHGYGQSGFPLSTAPRGLATTPPSPRLLPTLRSSLSLNESVPGSPNRIKVRDLNHIQSFASEEVLTRSRHGSRHSLRGRQDGGQQYEISAMPVTDIIEMVSGLLTKITTTNDRQHEHMPRHLPPEGATGLSQQTTSVLAFHGKNVPSITILSYLSRIHKYCPTTYEVFLSLLVYFDRMTEMINSGTLSSFRYTEDPVKTTHRPASTLGRPTESASNALHSPPGGTSKAEPFDLSHFFVVDSFNIHRLVIAGVTCASKFFSDVFYTNSRYAKVGGLPLIELNHLELQFLLLNDFRLSVPVEELEAYGSMLVEFYAKEVMAQQQSSHSTDALYMQSARPTPL